MRLPLKLLLRRALYFVLAFVGAFFLFLLVFALKCGFSRPAVPPLATVIMPKNDAADFGPNRRPIEDSYYSYPEWYIVWSYEERAQYLQKGALPSTFPYFASIGQYWRSYCFICGLTTARHQFNFGDHLSSVVLGSSFALEYGIRGAYEQTVGRFSEWTSSHQIVQEDVYAAKVAREYADFVYVRPFYEFHFAHALGQLWKETPLLGPHPIRKWERKAILSIDYGLEAIYAGILEKASHLTYGAESVDTYVWIDNAPESLFQDYPRIRKVKDLGGRAYIAIIPRYQEFTNIALKLASRDVHFVQVAGADAILITATGGTDWKYDFAEGNFLFSQDILTKPQLKRTALECAVRDLHRVLNDLASRGTRVEHIYDY